MTQKASAEQAVRDIRRKTRRKFSAEEKIRIVLDQNLFEIESQNISEAKVLLTLFAGKPVHGSLESLAAHSRE